MNRPFLICRLQSAFFAAAILAVCASLPLYCDSAPPPPDEAAAVSGASDDSVEIADLKREIETLRKRIGELERRYAGSPDALPQAETDSSIVAPPEAAEGTDHASAPEPAGAGRALLLPDISLIGNFLGNLSSDKRSGHRNSIDVEAVELGIQSYVYPGVKADVFIAMPHEDGHRAQVEEAYLSALNLGKGLSLRVGKSKVPFGRVNQLHAHSWLYVTQPSALANLVSPESLIGEGAYLSYLAPTPGKLFAQLDAGFWTNPAEPEFGDPTDPSAILKGAGAAFGDRFNTLRLWTSYPTTERSELELGASHAWGSGAIPPAHSVRPRVGLSGADVSYRIFQGNNKRLLLRGEHIWRRADHGAFPTARGYYLLVDQRLSAYREYALRYDWSQFPYAPGLHESSISGIFTNQLTEQTYLRLQITHGSRPGKSHYNELWLQWVWGVGPHTHDLE